MKKYKYLVTNGCSFVKGTGLADWKEETFSSLLSKRLRCKEVMLGSMGRDNNRILSTTYEWANKNIDNASESLIIIGTSQSSRKSIYSNGNKLWHNINWSIAEESKKRQENFIRQFNTSISNSEIKTIVEAIKIYIKYSHDEEVQVGVSNMNFELLVNYLKLKNFDVIIFNSFDNYKFSTSQFIFNSKEWDETQQNKMFFSWIELLRDFRKKDKEWDTKCTHPNKRAHKKMSELLYEAIEIL
tara:strand:- start:972 stop:1697 length:726 start_codon:yes stop_codon:yes gene_type:complete